jgi:hypothetical protein
MLYNCSRVSCLPDTLAWLHPSCFCFSLFLLFHLKFYKPSYVSCTASHSISYSIRSRAHAPHSLSYFSITLLGRSCLCASHFSSIPRTLYMLCTQYSLSIKLHQWFTLLLVTSITYSWKSLPHSYVVDPMCLIVLGAELERTCILPPEDRPPGKQGTFLGRPSLN